MAENPFDRTTRRQILATMLAAGMVGGAAGPAAAADFGSFNGDYARRVVLPALQNLVAATAGLVDAADRNCKDVTAPGIASLREAFQAVADAWAEAQMFRFGPLGESGRAERFAYWPERRNIIDKQLGALLATANTESLDAGRLAEASVAVQGLPALERLLYRDDPLPPSGCALIRAIASNLHGIAGESAAAWREAAGGAAPFAANATEATTQFYTNLLTLLQIIAEQKIGAPLGRDAAAARPKAAEQWRSSRSLRNIRLNLAASERAFLGPGGFVSLLGSEDLKRRAATAFADARLAADLAGDNLPDDVADPSRRHLLTELLVKVNHLRDLLRQDVPADIGITLGFNELDGDGS